MPGVAGAEEPGLQPMKTTHADAVKDMMVLLTSLQRCVVLLVSVTVHFSPDL